MTIMYPACFYKEKNRYSVVFPDLNYLATDGKTLDQAMNHAIDCLAGYIYLGKKEANKIPKASDISKIDANKVAKDLGVTNYKECFVNYVSVDVESYAKEHFEKAVKKTLTIPAWLNQLAIENNINFSKVLQDALIKKLM